MHLQSTLFGYPFGNPGLVTNTPCDWPVKFEQMLTVSSSAFSHKQKKNIVYSYNGCQAKCSSWSLCGYNVTTEIWLQTRCPPISGARRNAALISADVMCVISGDLASNRGRITRPSAGWTGIAQFYAVFSYILQPTGRSQRRHFRPIYERVHRP